jgi:hypothetical protein
MPTGVYKHKKRGFETKNIKCRNCGIIFAKPVSFLKQHPTTLFCSRLCYFKYIRKKKISKLNNCLICGKKVKEPRHEYCSRKCSDLARYKVELNRIGKEKYCPKCDKTLKILEFNKNKGKADGYNDYCKKCQKKYLKNYNKENKERLAPKRRIYCSNRRALLRGCEGKFTFQQWVNLCNKYNNVCLACGQKKPLTVDHIIPLSIGGENGIDNIQPLCGTCNRSKATKVINYIMET